MLRTATVLSRTASRRGWTRWPVDDGYLCWGSARPGREAAIPSGVTRAKRGHSGGDAAELRRSLLLVLALREFLDDLGAEGLQVVGLAA